MDKRKILIIDDDMLIRELLKNQLSAKPYEIIEAKNGVEGISKAISDKPDLILLDLHMPGMDGVEVIKKIKAQDNTKEIPIIVLTASGLNDEVVEALHSGANDFLTKQYQPDELIKKIEKHIS